MALNTAVQKSNKSMTHPNRLELIYSSHQELEDALDTLRAYVGAAKKHHVKADSEEGGFSPWAGVQNMAEKCIDKTCCCLRLFNPKRKVKHLKGMTTLEKLYGTEAAPQGRVVAFLASVRESFDGKLPLEVALTAGRCLQRLDPATADNYLVERIHDLLVQPSSPPTSSAADGKEQNTFHTLYQECLLLNPNTLAYRVHLRALLLLQIEVAAQAEHETHKLTCFDAKKLECALSSSICEELTKYERVCWREATRLRELKTSPMSPTFFEAAAGEKKALSSSSPTEETATTRTAQVPGAIESRRAAATAMAHFAGLSNWKLHALRITILVLLAVLVRLASTPLARALKSALQATNAAQSRRRTLTL